MKKAEKERAAAKEEEEEQEKVRASTSSKRSQTELGQRSRPILRGYHSHG